MAYTPKTWTCGELITDAGLNNIEEGIQEALGCCDGGLPEVTAADNGDMLTVVDGEWAKAEPGYKCTETSTTLTEESVTTSGIAPNISASLSYSTHIDAAYITATFDGTDYELNKVDLGWAVAYGDYPNRPDFTNYPLVILSGGGYNTIFTETAGTHSIKIVATNETVATSNCFEKAVKKFGLKYVKDANIVGGVLANDPYGNTVTARCALAEGAGTTASGDYSHAEGHGTTASGESSHAEGDLSEASDYSSHAEGYSTTASGIDSHAEGWDTIASDKASHAEGHKTTASKPNAHAEGDEATASGQASHAEGYKTTASGQYSHAEGNNTTASGDYSHAEGSNTTASNTSHAEGSNTTARGANSHAEGYGTTASGIDSHAEGYTTTASGQYSHAEGWLTKANHRSQHVFGEANIEDPSTAAATAKGTYIEIVGNGTGDSARSNARTLDWNGNEVLKGSLTLGQGTADETTVTATQLKALLALLP